MKTTERQQIYLYHAFILRQPLKDILKNTDLTKEEFKTWWADLEEEGLWIKTLTLHK